MAHLRRMGVWVCVVELCMQIVKCVRKWQEWYVCDCHWSCTCICGFVGGFEQETDETDTIKRYVFCDYDAECSTHVQHTHVVHGVCVCRLSDGEDCMTIETERITIKFQQTIIIFGAKLYAHPSSNAYGSSIALNDSRQRYGFCLVFKR